MRGNKKYLTTGQIAKMTSVSRRTVTKWIDQGLLRGFRIPGSKERRVPYNSVLKFIHQNGFHSDESRKVLLVNVERVFLERLKELLPESEDFNYEVAQSGFEAGIMAESFHPDTIVIDLVLGRTEAIQITANLRKNPAYENTFIVGLAVEDDAHTETLTELGFSEVFKKPFDVALLAERIRVAKP